MSLFIDEVTIGLKAGDGGNGAVTFRREKHVPRGGPEGGDGGRGGSIVFETDPNLSTLVEFRPGKQYRADRGGDGMSKRMFGKDGPDLVLKTPVGTQIWNTETNELLADLSHFPQREIIATSGRGGRGNSHFVSSIQQAPKFAEKGEPGEELQIRLELKLLADVGLLGFPNVGKSTLLSRVSAAKPKIADYPFTTLVPNLGVVRVDDQHNFVMADIPGLIEKASEGAGLGIQFLKHLERTRLLVHFIDVSGLSGRDPYTDFDIINRELANFSDDLAKLPQIIALSRIDVVTNREELQPIIDFYEAKKLPVYPISAVTGDGIEPLVYYLHRTLQEMPKEAAMLDGSKGPIRITLNSRQSDEDPKRFTVLRNADGILVVTGKGIERMVAMTDLENEYGLRRLQRKFERVGLFQKLKEAGAVEGDTVQIKNMGFDYIEDEWADDTTVKPEEDEEDV
jgi:GTP-binding protein